MLLNHVRVFFQISEAVHRNLKVTEATLESAARDWLKYTRDRDGGRKAR